MYIVHRCTTFHCTVALHGAQRTHGCTQKSRAADEGQRVSDMPTIVFIVIMLIMGVWLNLNETKGVKTTRPLWQLDPNDNSTLVTTRKLDPYDNSTCDNSILVTTRSLWQLDPCDNSTLVTTRPLWQLDPCDNSTLVTTRPLWQLDPCDNSTLVTTRPLWQHDPCDNSTLVTTRPSKHLILETTRVLRQLDPCGTGWLWLWHSTWSARTTQPLCQQYTTSLCHN